MRNTRFSILAALLTLGLAAGCGGEVTTEQPDADDSLADAAGTVADALPQPDASPPDGMPPPMPKSTSIVQTSGGGVAASVGYRAHVRIGAPQPSGVAAGSGRRVRLGPFAH